MKNTFLVPDAFGNPDENWFGWLKENLESLGYTVTIPVFPTPQN